MWIILALLFSKKVRIINRLTIEEDSNCCSRLLCTVRLDQFIPCMVHWLKVTQKWPILIKHFEVFFVKADSNDCVKNCNQVNAGMCSSSIHRIFYWFFVFSGTVKRVFPALRWPVPIYMRVMFLILVFQNERFNRFLRFSFSFWGEISPLVREHLAIQFSTPIKTLSHDNIFKICDFPITCPRAVCHLGRLYTLTFK